MVVVPTNQATQTSSSSSTPLLTLSMNVFLSTDHKHGGGATNQLGKLPVHPRNVATRFPWAMIHPQPRMMASAIHTESWLCQSWNRTPTSWRVNLCSGTDTMNSNHLISRRRFGQLMNCNGRTRESKKIRQPAWLFWIRYSPRQQLPMLGAPTYRPTPHQPGPPTLAARTRHHSNRALYHGDRVGEW